MDEIGKSQIYEIFTNLLLHSENVRWIRFNNLLVVNSVLIVAWVAIFSSSNDIKYKSMLLTIICIPGIVLGILWAFLGDRSSKYIDAYHRRAEKIEKNLSDDDLKPFHVSEEIRGTARKGFSQLTSSRWIVTWIPIVFSIFFIILIVASWIKDI